MRTPCKLNLTYALSLHFCASPLALEGTNERVRRRQMMQVALLDVTIDRSEAF